MINESVGQSSEKRRLTFVISHMGGGGAERVMANMANYWAEAGWSITLLSMADDSEPPAYELHRRVAFAPLGISSRERNPVFKIDNLRRLLILRRAIRESQPEVIISFIEKVNVAVLLAAVGLGVPVLVREQIDQEMYRIGPLWELFRRLTYPIATRVIVLSRKSRERFPKRLQDRTVIIPNPVNVPPAPAPRDDKAPNARSIVAMGRLDRQKGFDVLLRAFALLKEKRPDWALTILGEGPDREELTGLSRRLGLAEAVHLPGWAPNPHEALRKRDIFVLSSRYEGFPNALCEAMACGLPAIATDCPTGPADIIRNNVDGLLVPPGDPAALASAMDRLMADEGLRARLASQATKIVERFGLDKVMGAWEELIREVGPPTARLTLGEQ